MDPRHHAKRRTEQGLTLTALSAMSGDNRLKRVA